MKKFIFALVFGLISIMSYGQTFTSESIDKDSATFSEMMSKYKKRGNIKWAENLSQEFTVDENKILAFKNIITYSDSVYVDNIMDKTIEWVNYNFTGPEAIKSIDRESDVKTIVIEASLGKVAQNTVNLIYYVKKIDVYADMQMIIKFKDNRLRIETYTKEYTFNSGDSFLTGKHYIINPGNVFPFSDDKASIGDDVTYAVAYINTVDNLIRFNRSYKDFLNKEFKKTNLYISDDEDW